MSDTCDEETARIINREVSDGTYSRGASANILTPVYHEIFGKKWGIVGYGNIGKQVARVAEALGCSVVVNKRTPVDDAECVDIDTLCRECDIISVHTPLNDGTRGLISRERIASMKKEVIFINVARGAVVDEGALAEAVKEGRVGAVGVDVYSKEPFPCDHPYSEIKCLDNVVTLGNPPPGAAGSRCTAVHWAEMPPWRPEEPEDAPARAGILRRRCRCP